MQEFIMSPKLFYGKGSLLKLKDIQGKKVFIVTDKVMVNTGNVAKITFMLDEIDIDWLVFSQVEPDPSLEIVELGLEKMIDFNPDTIIALGGGSSIDAAKAILYYYMKIVKRFTSDDFYKPELIAIPTTSGTGSEVTSYSVVTDNERNVKIPLVDHIMLPEIAILEPELVKTVPASSTAFTGLDVLTHAIEAYVSKGANDFTNPYALSAIKGVYKYLLTAYENGDDMEAREKMHNYSSMAGIAFNNAGLGINHSIAHSLGGIFKLPHGMVNGILLPYIIEFNSGINRELNEEVAEKYWEISKYLKLPSETMEMGVKSLILSIEILKEKMEVPKSFNQLDISEEEFLSSLEEVSKLALEDFCTPTNPVEVNEKEVLDIVKKSYYG